MDRSRPRWAVDLSTGSDDTLFDLDTVRCWLRQNIRRGYRTGACHDPLARSLGARITIEVSRDTDIIMVRIAFAEKVVSSVDPMGERRWHGAATKMVSGFTQARAPIVFTES